MTISLTIGGHNVSAYTISIDRTDRICTPGQVYLIEIDSNCPHTLYPWDTLVLSESGTKVLTGYVASVSEEISANTRWIIEGVDTWKRALDWWTYEEYYTSGDTVLGLIAKYLTMCGLSYTLESNVSITAPDGLVIPIQPVSEILVKLASSAGLFYLIDADGVVHVNNVTDTMNNGAAIAEADNLINIDLQQSDYRARNKVVVWGPTTMAIVRCDTDWAVVDHTMVYANPYIYDANAVAQFMLSQFRDLEEVVTCETTHDPSRRIGQKVAITSDIFTGTEIVTTVKSRWDKSVGAQMTTVVGERCWGGAGPQGFIDGRDLIVATKECGVWRCMDIWADTPHWYSLNEGLEENFLWGGVDQGSTFDCEWFIRDPYAPNDLCFLLTRSGIFVTNSTEPGTCDWNPRLMNQDLTPYGTMYITNYGSAPFWISRIRSTVARQGAYYATINTPTGGHDSLFIAATNDHFRHIHWGGIGSIDSRLSWVPFDRPIIVTDLVGNDATNNYGNQRQSAMATWHRTHGYLSNNVGSLAAWHRNDHGCSVTACANALAITAHGQMWKCERGSVNPDYFDATTAPHACDRDEMVFPHHGWEGKNSHCYFTWGGYDPYGHGCTVLSPSTVAWWPQADLKVFSSPVAGWYFANSMHIPYDQTYDSDGPTTYFLNPGYAVGAGYTLTALGPSRMVNGVHTNLTPPWGTTPSLCNYMQGSIATYTQDINRVFCFSGSNPSYVATSEDMGDTWTDRGSVPFATSCFSGFPRSEQKIYAGRDPNRDASAGNDRALIYVSWDRGETWTDVTGDLWTETQALNLRFDNDNNPLGTAGLVTIAPRYC